MCPIVFIEKKSFSEKTMLNLNILGNSIGLMGSDSFIFRFIHVLANGFWVVVSIHRPGTMSQRLHDVAILAHETTCCASFACQCYQ